MVVSLLSEQCVEAYKEFFLTRALSPEAYFFFASARQKFKNTGLSMCTSSDTISERPIRFFCLTSILKSFCAAYAVLLGGCVHFHPTQDSIQNLSQDCLANVQTPQWLDRENNYPSIELSKNGKPILIIVGSVHSKDATNPQFKLIEQTFVRFRPTLALFEGRGDKIYSSIEKAITHGGEPALVRKLAHIENVRSGSFEPSIDHIVKDLTNEFGVERTQLFLLLQRINHHQRAGFDPARIERRIRWYMENTFPDAPSGETWPINDFNELDEAAQSYWSDFDINDVPSVWFDPRLSGNSTGGGYINQAVAFQSNLRNRYLYKFVVDELSRDEKVFVVIGNGHLNPLRPAFQCLQSQLE